MPEEGPKKDTTPPELIPKLVALGIGETFAKKMGAEQAYKLLGEKPPEHVKVESKPLPPAPPVAPAPIPPKPLAPPTPVVTPPAPAPAPEVITVAPLPVAVPELAPTPTFIQTKITKEGAGPLTRENIETILEIAREGELNKEEKLFLAYRYRDNKDIPPKEFLMMLRRNLHRLATEEDMKKAADDYASEIIFEFEGEGMKVSKLGNAARPLELQEGVIEVSEIPAKDIGAPGEKAIDLTEIKNFSDKSRKELEDIINLALRGLKENETTRESLLKLRPEEVVGRENTEEQKREIEKIDKMLQHMSARDDQMREDIKQAAEALDALGVEPTSPKSQKEKGRFFRIFDRALQREKRAWKTWLGIGAVVVGGAVATKYAEDMGKKDYPKPKIVEKKDREAKRVLTQTNETPAFTNIPPVVAKTNTPPTPEVKPTQKPTPVEIARKRVEEEYSKAQKNPETDEERVERLRGRRWKKGENNTWVREMAGGQQIITPNGKVNTYYRDNRKSQEQTLPSADLRDFYPAK